MLQLHKGIMRLQLQHNVIEHEIVSWVLAALTDPGMLADLSLKAPCENSNKHAPSLRQVKA